MSSNLVILCKAVVGNGDDITHDQKSLRRDNTTALTADGASLSFRTLGIVVGVG